MIYTTPGRYHWMYQYYLKDEGINLSWVGTVR
jgi:glutamate-1-semialdehyde 2,1-aminomutase